MIISIDIPEKAVESIAKFYGWSSGSQVDFLGAVFLRMCREALERQLEAEAKAVVAEQVAKSCKNIWKEKP